jgi:hypothetical protein
MKALQLAFSTGRYDLAAHVIVLACARAIKNGGSSHGGKTAKKLLLHEAERQELRSAVALEGIDDEIAVMRVRIKKLIQTADIEELTRCTNALCRMLMTRYAIEGKSKKSLKAALGNVLREIALPLGIAAISKKL